MKYKLLFAERLKELRLKNNLTQKQLAEALNINQTKIGNWERKRGKPRYDVLIKIADCFKVSVDYLLGFDKKI